MRLLFICAVLSVWTGFVFAHKEEVIISGVVTSADSKVQEFVSIHLKNTMFGAMSDENGHFKMSVPAGDYTLVANLLGYKTLEKPVNLRSDQRNSVKIVLHEDELVLDEVVVTGKSLVQQVKESAYNVTAIDAKALHNTTLDIAHTLDRMSGVRLRESGGVGSDISFSLNGFSGKHVKFFMDGVPMEGFGSSFQINNIPVNMAERIEVYKGVVPVAFGADALGGVVNIVTKKGKNNFLDASYSFGSFNTHKSYVNFGYTYKSGLTLNLNLFQNYSDNNYPVYVRLVDSSGNFEESETKVKRFHDTYRNESIVAQLGVVGKRYADRLLFGFVMGQNKADIQTGNNMDFVYGEKFREGNTLMPTVAYQVRDLFLNGLDVSLNGNYNFGYTQNVDTATYRKYNWQGGYKPSSQKGESAYQLYKYRDNNGTFTFGTNYKLNERHLFTLNDVLSTFHRQGKDLLASDNDDNFPSLNTQNVLGIGYNYTHSKRWNINLFYKHYSKYSESHLLSGTEYVLSSKRFSTSGYGVATTYFLGDHIQFKASYEKAYRLPTSRELFGNSDLELGNDSLKAESSNNFNLGANYNVVFNRSHSLNLDAGLAYRDISNFIRRKVSESNGTAGSVNDGHVSNIGINAEARYSFKSILMIGANVTYQNIRNKDKYNGSKPNLVYNDRVPNIPYLYGNADVSLFFNDLGKRGNTLTLGYNASYVNEFYLRWPSYGSAESKYTVPSQFSHDINVAYSLKKGTYNITLECRNITDERLYDNYSLQKPGRSFSAKFRYYLRFN